jgi:hypothetical protein
VIVDRLADEIERSNAEIERFRSTSSKGPSANSAARLTVLLSRGSGGRTVAGEDLRNGGQHHA